LFEVGYLFRLGDVLHLSTSRHLILRAKAIPLIGTAAYDEDLKKIGIVIEVFGPVKQPYISVKPSVSKPDSYVGKMLYSL
jgi:RNA-binding protein